MALVKVRQKGQVTISKEIQEAMGVQEGGLIVLTVDQNGLLQGRAIKTTSLGALAGALGEYADGLDVPLEDAIRKSNRRRAVQRFTRSTEQESGE